LIAQQGAQGQPERVVASAWTRSIAVARRCQLASDREKPRLEVESDHPPTCADPCREQ
jgi:hypothetical protein